MEVSEILPNFDDECAQYDKWGNFLIAQIALVVHDGVGIVLFGFVGCLPI